MPHVLVVEDNPSIRASLEELLVFEGYAVTGAENGRVALDTLDGGVAPCAILLDLMMPEMDGWEFLETVRETPHASVPVVVLTGVADSHDTADLPGRFGCLVFRKGGGLKPVLDAVAKACGRAIVT